MNIRAQKAFANHLSGMLIFLMMPMMVLRDVFKVHTAREFWPSLATHTVAGAALLLFVSVLQILFLSMRSDKRKMEQKEWEEQTRQARRAMGTQAITKMLLRLYCGSLCLAFAVQFLDRPAASPLHLGHYLVVALVGGLLAVTAHVASLLYLDRLADNPPCPGLPATESVRWLFKGNE